MEAIRNPYAPPRAEVADVVQAVPVEAAPALWNPRAAVNWSLLFTPVFGALLHMRNWQALGEPQRAARSKAWAWGSFAFFIALTVVSAVLPDSRAMDGVSRIGGLALLVSWYYAAGKEQQAYVLVRFGKGYPRKGWGKPLLLGVAGIAAFLFAAVVVGLLVGVAA